MQNVKDPEKRGRIRVACPKVLGDAVSNWCEPCVPVAIDLEGDFAIPPVGEAVWVEFEEGEANQPIWVGGWWSAGKTPSESYTTTDRIIRWKGCRIRMRENSLRLNVGDNYIQITNNSIDIRGNKITSIEY